MYDRSIAIKLDSLQRQINDIRKGQRVAHGASIENAALEVNDSDGVLRAVIGVQPDGTTGVVAHNGPPPGAPSAPIVTPSIAGLRVTWDGTLADDSPLPADFDHIAVHVSQTTDFDPSTATFAGTITKAGDGGMLPITPLPYAAHYVRLVGVNTSGIGGAPSAQTTGTPVQVDGPDLTAGSVTAGTIAAGAITADKLEAILVLATRILAGSPAGARVEINEDGLRAYDASGNLTVSIDAATGAATFTGNIIGGAIAGAAITGSTVTGGQLQTGFSGARVVVTPTPPVGLVQRPSMLLYSGVTGELLPAVLNSGPGPSYSAQGVTVLVAPTVALDSSGNQTQANMTLSSPKAGSFPGRMQMATANSFATSEIGYVSLDGQSATTTSGTSYLSLYVKDGNSTGKHSSIYATGAYVNVTADSVTHQFNPNGLIVTGSLTAGNIASGTVTITPSAANTPTSFGVTGLNVAGSTFRGYATANTTVPGSRVNATPSAAGVTGVSVSSVSSTGLTVWLNRENTTATSINWMVIGS